jgi:hypothetical protein
MLPASSAAAVIIFISGAFANWLAKRIDKVAAPSDTNVNRTGEIKTKCGTPAQVRMGSNRVFYTPIGNRSNAQSGRGNSGLAINGEVREQRHRED